MARQVWTIESNNMRIDGFPKGPRGLSAPPVLPALTSPRGHRKQEVVSTTAFS